MRKCICRVRKSVNIPSLKRDFEGEQKSDVWLEWLSKEWLIIHDLLLEYNNSKFQIDTLLISQDKIYPLDVKNFEGDYYVEGDNWYTSAKKDVKNPVHQLDRCETLLRALLRDLGYHYPLETYLIFINLSTGIIRSLRSPLSRFFYPRTLVASTSHHCTLFLPPAPINPYQSTNKKRLTKEIWLASTLLAHRYTLSPG